MGELLVTAIGRFWLAFFFFSHLSVLFCLSWRNPVAQKRYGWRGLLAYTLQRLQGVQVSVVFLRSSLPN